MIVERRVIIRSIQQTLNGQQQSGNCIGWAPLILENIQTDVSAHVDVGVEDRGFELDRGGCEGIACWELHV